MISVFERFVAAISLGSVIKSTELSFFRNANVLFVVKCFQAKKKGFLLLVVSKYHKVLNVVSPKVLFRDS